MNNTAAKPNRLAFFTLLLVVLAGVWAFPRVSIPYLDTAADQYFSEAIVKAGAVYGSLRLLNAVIAPIKNSDVQVQPAGLGITLALGNLLDPVYNMLEQASSVMMLSITSLGVQKIVYEVSVFFAPSLIAIGLLALLPLYWLNDLRWLRLRLLIKKLIVICLALRLCLPIAGMVSMGLQELYFADKIEQAHQQLIKETPTPPSIPHNLSAPQGDGFWNAFSDKLDYVKQKTQKLAADLQAIAASADDIVVNMLYLSYLYVALLLFQVLIIPLASFFIVLRLCSSLFNKEIEYQLWQASLAKRQAARH